MWEKSFGILFYLRKQRNETLDLRYIYLRVTVDGVPREVSVKRSWTAARWNSKANRASGTKEDAGQLNAYLDVMQNKVHQAKKDLVESGRVSTAQAIIDIISGAEQRRRSLMNLFLEHNECLKKMVGKGVAQGIWTNFNTSYNHVAAFLRAEYRTDEINILSLNLEFVKKLYNWFRAVKNLGHNTALKNIANLKKIVIACVDNGWLITDPFLKFDLTQEEVETTFLVKEEMKAILEKVIRNQRLSRVRDVFIFCCFTGLAFADVKQLKKSEVTLGFDGDLKIYKNRQKTGTPSLIPLLPITLQILAKYERDEDCIVKDQLLPVLSNQKYNAYLKEIADLCGIQKESKTHVARHTFGTTVTLANSVPLESIKEMMGHKSLRQTMHYAKVSGIKVTEDMALLKKRLKERNFISGAQIMQDKPDKIQR